MGDPGGPLRLPAGQRPARQAGPRPQDRRHRRPVDLPPRRGRPAAPKPGAAQADPHAAQPDPLPQGPDPRPPARGRPAAQAHGGHRHQARLRRLRPARQVGPREARQGRFDTEHALIVGRILAHIDYLDEAIAELSQTIERQIAPFANAVELLCTIPGVQRRTAEVIIAETGGDMSAFPTAKHLASWAGVCPGNDESAGKRRSGRTTKGSKWLRAALTEAAKAASRSRDTYLPAQYQRLRGRRGHNKATTAIAHSMLTAAWHMLQTGETYTDPGGDYFVRRDPERTTRRLVARLERLGHTVTLQEAKVAT